MIFGFSRTKVVEPQPPARDVHAEEEKRKQVLDTAINLLRLSGTRMTPEELAKKVGITLGFEVTTQSLSKGLAKRGIRTKKVKGRRVFAFAGIAHRVARRARSSSRLRRTARTRGRQKRGNGEAQLSESSYSL